jgi:hypothetical protein
VHEMESRFLPALTRCAGGLGELLLG